MAMNAALWAEMGPRASWCMVFENQRWSGHPEHLGDLLETAVYWATYPHRGETE